MARNTFVRAANDFFTAGMFSRGDSSHFKFAASCQGQGQLLKCVQHSMRLNSSKSFAWRNCGGEGRSIVTNLRRAMKKYSEKMNDKLNFITVLFARQCNVIAAQRIQRATQIITLYSKLGYDKHALRKAVERLRLSLRNNKFPFLFGAALFSWEKERITEKEVTECVID